MANKLELTWCGKDEPIRIEPCLLIGNRIGENPLQLCVTGFETVVPVCKEIRTVDKGSGFKSEVQSFFYVKHK